MKGDNKVRLFIIYMLILVIIGLVGFLIYFIIHSTSENQKALNDKLETLEKKKEISENCTFNVTVKDFNRLLRNVSALTLCENYNKLVLSDIDFTKVHVIYYNGFLDDDSKQYGIYINGKQVTVGASFDNKNEINVFDDLIFIKKENMESTDVLVYNASSKLIYDLEMALAKLKIEDKLFKDLDSVKNKVVSLKNIDINSYEFKEGEFTFNTISECALGQQYSGSSYKVSYKDGKFNSPEFINYVEC